MAEKINIGPTDRVMRLIVGVVILLLAFVFPGGFSIVYGLLAGVIGLLLLGTGLLKICFVYRALGFSTKPKLPCN